MGVPYAKPPIGPLRLKPPQPPQAWSDVRDALHRPHDCMQKLRYGLENIGLILNVSEDCLFLNVYAPGNLSSPTPLPVMVWIHGGGFLVGYAAAYDGTALARKGVVVVTINYRLDAFGFLSHEDEGLPGNFGLLDQILALRWVNENIVNFGGDPKEVTLFGESAGACSASLLTVSPIAAGLFKRAIVESGSSLAPWCVIFPTNSLRPATIAERIGARLNCSGQDSQKLLQCLQSVDAAMLLGASVDVQIEAKINAILIPVVNANVLPDLPRALLTQDRIHRVDTLRGFNANEAGALKPNFTSGASRQEFRTFLEEKLANFNVKDKDAIIQQYENLNIRNVSDPNVILQKSSEAVSNFFYMSPLLIELDLISKAAGNRKHYLYEFNYRKSISNLPTWATAEHADEVPFILREFAFPLWISRDPPTQDDLLVSEQMATMWSNFAKTGDPTSSVPLGATQWPAYTSSDPRLLKISKVSTVTPPGRQEAVEIYKRLLPILENTAGDVVIG